MSTTDSDSKWVQAAAAKTVEKRSVRRTLRPYPKEKLQEALQLMEKGAGPSAAHQATGLPRSTLQGYKTVMDQSGMSADELKIPDLGRPTILSKPTLKRLHDFFVECQLANCPLTREHAARVVLDVLRAENNQHMFDTKDGLPGRSWFDTFYALFPDLSERVPNRLSAAALRAEDPALITESLNKFKARKEGVREERCFTMDEFMAKGDKNATGRVRVISLRGRRGVRAMAHSSGGGHITAINCIDGTGLKPLDTVILQKGVEHFKIEKLGDHIVKMGRTAKGWQNGRSLLFWLKWFRDEVKPTADDPVLLVVDQHSSRFNLHVMEFCRDNHIRLFVLPPNLTHLLSPLDRTCHKAMRTSIQGSLSRLLTRFADMSVKDLGAILNPAWTAAFKSEIVQNGWRKAGLIPFDPQAPIAEIAARKAEDVKKKADKQKQQQAAENARQAERKADGKEAKAAAGDGKQDPAAAVDAALQVPQIPPAKPRRFKRPQFPTGGDLTEAKAIEDMRQYEKNKEAEAADKKQSAANGTGRGRGRRRGGKRRGSRAESSESSESETGESSDSGGEGDAGESEGEEEDGDAEDAHLAGVVQCGYCKSSVADFSSAVQCSVCSVVQHARCAGPSAGESVEWTCANCKGKRKNKKQ